MRPPVSSPLPVMAPPSPSLSLWRSGGQEPERRALHHGPGPLGVPCGKPHRGFPSGAGLERLHQRPPNACKPLRWGVMSPQGAWEQPERAGQLPRPPRESPRKPGRRSQPQGHPGYLGLGEAGPRESGPGLAASPRRSAAWCLGGVVVAVAPPVGGPFPSPAGVPAVASWVVAVALVGVLRRPPAVVPAAGLLCFFRVSSGP